MKIQLRRNANLFPVMPVVLISSRGIKKPYDKPDIVTVSRIAPVTTSPVRVAVSLKEVRYSYEQILETGEFAINIPGQALLRQTDWCGIRSGHDVDKLAQTGLTPVTVPELVYAPGIQEADIIAGCKVVDRINHAKYGIFIGEIVSILADERVLTEGRLSVEKMAPIVFDGIAALYRSTGEPRGQYGFSVKAEGK